MTEDLVVWIVMIHALFCDGHLLTRQAKNEGAYAMSANFPISEWLGTLK